MSKHGNNNAKWVLKSEHNNLKYYAGHLLELADNMRDEPIKILGESGQEMVCEMIMRLEKTVSELKTILPIKEI